MFPYFIIPSPKNNITDNIIPDAIPIKIIPFSLNSFREIIVAVIDPIMYPPNNPIITMPIPANPSPCVFAMFPVIIPPINASISPDNNPTKTDNIWFLCVFFILILSRQDSDLIQVFQVI